MFRVLLTIGIAVQLLGLVGVCLGGGAAWQGAVAVFSLFITGRLLADEVQEAKEDAAEAAAKE